MRALGEHKGKGSKKALVGTPVLFLNINCFCATQKKAFITISNWK